MKRFLLVLSLFFVGSISAQTLQQFNADIQMPSNANAMDGASSFAKAAACGPDTNGYALAKATGLEALNINSATSAGAVAQYFDAPQSLTISGMSFYAWKPDATGGISINVNVEIYAAAADSTPTGSPLATAVVAVDTSFAPGTLDVLRKEANFAMPVTVSSAYVMVLSNPTATPISAVFNSWTALDGAQEWLSSALVGVNWLRGYELNIGGAIFDADCLFEPHVTYDLTASFTVDDPCFSNGLALNFTNGSSAITGNRMYNVAAFQNITEFSYTWDYGDASPTENLIDASHTYASAGSYTVTLTDTIYGWTTNCATDTMVALGSAPTAGYTSVETGLSSAFTNTSVSGSGTTYLWDFGDGNTSTSMDPTHSYVSAGSYTVCLTTTDACGSDISCATVTVSCSAPVPIYGFSGTAPTFTFTDMSSAAAGATYLWDFGDGNTSTLMNPSHTFAADGMYTVCLTVTDVCGLDSTCQLVTVTSCANPTAGFTTAGTSPTYDFTNTSTTTGTATYAWDFGDGNTAASVDASNTYATNGTFTVTLMVTDSCGTNTFTSTVDVSGIGLDELTLADVSVYPNPSTGVFAIEATMEMETAYITDLSGKLIYTGSLSGNETTIDATQFANGTYLLSIRFADDMIQTVRLEVVK